MTPTSSLRTKQYKSMDPGAFEVCLAKEAQYVNVKQGTRYVDVDVNGADPLIRFSVVFVETVIKVLTRIDVESEIYRGRRRVRSMIT